MHNVSHENLTAFVIYASATDRCVGSIVLGCLCFRACVCHACVLLARYLTNQQMEFHQSAVTGVLEVT